MKRIVSLRLRGLWAPALLAGWMAATTSAGEVTDPLRVLFVGNSYTYVNDLPGTVQALGASDRPPVRIVVDKAVKGGATLQQHADNPAVREKIRTGRYTLVVLQEQSMLPVVDAAAMQKGAEALQAEIRRTGAGTVLFMTWPRAAKPDMLEGLRSAYHGTARGLGARVAPVGEAWMQVRAKNPETALYAKDGSHPSPSGSYLAACVMYETLTGRPAPAAALPAGVPAAAAPVLRAAAHAVFDKTLQSAETAP